MATGSGRPTRPTPLQPLLSPSHPPLPLPHPLPPGCPIMVGPPLSSTQGESSPAPSPMPLPLTRPPPLPLPLPLPLPRALVPHPCPCFSTLQGPSPLIPFPPLLRFLPRPGSPSSSSRMSYFLVRLPAALLFQVPPCPAAVHVDVQNRIQLHPERPQPTAESSDTEICAVSRYRWATPLLLSSKCNVRRCSIFLFSPCAHLDNTR